LIDQTGRANRKRIYLKGYGNRKYSDTKYVYDLFDMLLNKIKLKVISHARATW
jgi:hypothetical protein